MIQPTSIVKRFGLVRVLLAAVAVAATALVMSGCLEPTNMASDVDSYLDPSVTGRWENTPIILPILDKIDVIEEPEAAIPGLDQPTRDDLIPQIAEYVLGPGDLVTITIFELLTPNTDFVQTRRIDELGFIRLPVIGKIKAAGLTTQQLEQRLVDILHPDILRDPMVTVILQEGRQKTFSMLGAVGATGTYSLPKDNFRLLDAIALARGIPQQTKVLYVIRQVPLSDVVEGRQYGEQRRPGEFTPPPSPGEAGDGRPAPGDGDIGELIEGLGEGAMPDDGAADDAADEADDDAAGELDDALDGQGGEGGRWVNIDGRWVKVEADAPVQADPAELDVDESQLPPVDQLVTQRVIEVDAQRLLQGVAAVNLVVRPGDVIRVPSPVGGNCFVGGEIARPGTYSVPGEKEFTLTQLIKAAGGLGPLAIPERVDLRRRLDENTEAIIRLNYRAIAEGVQPNIFIKPDDEINIGTNLAAPFLAVTRNAFRMSYGFGFLLDRNFGQQVFGDLD